MINKKSHDDVNWIQLLRQVMYEHTAAELTRCFCRKQVAEHVKDGRCVSFASRSLQAKCNITRCTALC